MTSRASRHVLCAFVVVAVTGAASSPSLAEAQVTAKARPGATPAWSKGLKPVDAESYYHAIECGKQGGEDPPCVFWDTGICKNDDFELAFYSGYKQVAYEVWTAVRKKQKPPQPSYRAAQQTRVTIGVSPVKGSKNVFTGLVLKRGNTVVDPVARSVMGGTGNYTFDYPAWAPTRSVTLEMAGKTRTVSCTIPVAVLQQMR